MGIYPPIMENQMEKKMENEMETRIMQGFLGILSYSLNSLKGDFIGVYIGDYYRG